MSIFQKSVVNKYLKTLDNEKVNQAFEIFRNYYGDKLRIFNIIHLKEENYQEGFLREIFVNVLGYTINPDRDYNLTTEFKNQTDNKKADGVIIKDGKAIGVIELKSTKTQFIETITNQAFNYKHNQPNCRFVITSNFHYLRFYIDNSVDFEEFDLFQLSEFEFKRFYLFLNKESIFNDTTLKLKEETKFHEESISDKFYRDYKQFKDKIFENLVKNNSQFEKLTLYKKSQKLLDRFLFIWFAEDCGLVPPNAISRIIDQWKQLIELEKEDTLYSRFQIMFNHLNVGHKYKNYELPGYNGGLFKHDDLLDNPNLIIDDKILLEDCLKLSGYDYNTEVDVNILGHIFEHSLNEIEEITAELKGEKFEKSQTKRKKEGIFYTPEYITHYIIENTVGELCKNKRIELNINEIVINESFRKNNKITKQGKELYEILQTYKNWLFGLKILDPACGSGAFLNHSLSFLLNEHKLIDDIISELTDDKLRLHDTDKNILENNIFGVDINEESVEIAKLSLWLRTAKKDRKLSDLSNNIKCGNSLIDNKDLAENKAFNWKNEFPEIMQKGGFDIVIGNPPYVGRSSSIKDNEKPYIKQTYSTAEGKFELYQLFIELATKITKPQKGYISYITPQTWLSIIQATKLRKLLILNFDIEQIVYLGNDVFNASVDTIIFILKTGAKTERIKYFVTENGFDNQSLLLYKDILANQINQETFVIPVSHYDSSNSLFSKIYQDSIKLSEIGTWFDGVKVVGKAKSFAFQYFHFDDTFFPMLSGSDIDKNYINWSGLYCCRDKNKILQHNATDIRLRDERAFNSPKILLRKTGNKIVATIDNDKYYYEQSLFGFSLFDNQYDLRFIVAVLNSKLAHFLLSNNPFSKKETFPQIRLHWLKDFPINVSNIQIQKEIIEKTQEIIELKKQFHSNVKKFITRILSNFSIEKITNNMLNFSNMLFIDFYAELKKQNLKLTYKQQEELEEYFNDKKKYLLDLQRNIDNFDKQVNLLVYRLYELTPEEIKNVDETD